MEHLLEAKVIDSQHLKLKRAIDLAPGSTVIITIKPAGSVADEQAWYQLSSQGLAGAYSVNEPDYSLEMIKDPNLDYVP